MKLVWEVKEEKNESVINIDKRKNKIKFAQIEKVWRGGEEETKNRWMKVLEASLSHVHEEQLINCVTLSK